MCNSSKTTAVWRLKEEQSNSLWKGGKAELKYNTLHVIQSRFKVRVRLSMVTTHNYLEVIISTSEFWHECPVWLRRTALCTRKDGASDLCRGEGPAGDGLPSGVIDVGHLCKAYKPKLQLRPWTVTHFSF